jgi:hypothetical protein
MNAKANKNSVSTKTVKETKHKEKTGVDVTPDYIVRRLNEDVRNSVLVVSLLANLFVLIAWLVVQVSTRYDAALIYYLQNR